MHLERKEVSSFKFISQGKSKGFLSLPSCHVDFNCRGNFDDLQFGCCGQIWIVNHVSSLVFGLQRCSDEILIAKTRAQEGEAYVGFDWWIWV